MKAWSVWPSGPTPSTLRLPRRAFIVSRKAPWVATRYARDASPGRLAVDMGVSFCVPSQQPQVAVVQPHLLVSGGVGPPRVVVISEPFADDNLQPATLGVVPVV